MHTHLRTFDEFSHEEFARISGDCNPIHIDAVAARRTQAGTRIVHGIHSLLWVLDCCARHEPAVSGGRNLKVQFLQPIYVGDAAQVEISSLGPRGVRARVVVGTEEVLLATIGFSELQVAPLERVRAPAAAVPETPIDRCLEEMKGLIGSLSFAPAFRELTSRFPAAAEVFGLRRIASLACSSCLVGMVVPGLHSMFLGLDVSLAKDDGALHEAIDFAVLSLTERFRMVRIGISGPGLSGTLQTMSRLPPARQPGIGRVIDAVNGQEFQNSVALVVGGSRGLGEVAAKLIAAGGGEVVITYWRGEKDAQSVASEITAAGLRCKAVRFDIQESSSSQLEALNVTPTHLYYFATPPIFQRKSGVFDAARFAEFNTYYVKGFFDVVTSCAALSRDALRVFYPSSSAIDSRPANMTEYTMSKAAAETLCADLTKFVPGIHVLTRRLPRLATDQTISVVQAKTADSVDVMLAIIREMHGDRLETRNG